MKIKPDGPFLREALNKIKSYVGNDSFSNMEKLNIAYTLFNRKYWFHDGWDAADLELLELFIGVNGHALFKLWKAQKDAKESISHGHRNQNHHRKKKGQGKASNN